MIAFRQFSLYSLFLAIFFAFFLAEISANPQEQQSPEFWGSPWGLYGGYGFGGSPWGLYGGGYGFGYPWGGYGRGLCCSRRWF
jgi:uncharacterized membrane protein